jgi:ethanolamine utilization protein EutN
MRIARVIGKLTLARSDDSLRGARYLIAVPLSLRTLKSGGPEDAEELVVYDELGASEGQLIAVSESAEASAPFHPQQKPVDAYCAAILDTIELPAMDS